MKKTLIYKGILLAIMIAAMFSTVLSVYTTKILINQTSFRFDLFVGTIGSYALVIGLIILSIVVILKIVGGDNGKNS